jgi:hypothetical protein
VGKDGDMQQVIGVNVNRQVHTLCVQRFIFSAGLSFLGTRTYFSSTPTTPLDLTRPNKAATGNNS